MRQQPESHKSEGGPLDLKDYLRIWRRPQTWQCLLHNFCETGNGPHPDFNHSDKLLQSAKTKALPLHIIAQNFFPSPNYVIKFVALIWAHQIITLNHREKPSIFVTWRLKEKRFTEFVRQYMDYYMPYNLPITFLDITRCDNNRPGHVRK